MRTRLALMTFVLLSGCTSTAPPTPMTGAAPPPAAAVPGLVAMAEPPVAGEVIPYAWDHVPPGGIDWEVWYLRTWPIPAWRDDMPVNKARCLSGLVNRASNAHIWSDRRTYVDIDGDGRFETAILWHCYTDDGRPEAEQVVVYRFAAGRPEIVSQVIATTGGVRQILELEGRTSGVLRVRVGSERDRISERWAGRLEPGASQTTELTFLMAARGDFHLHITVLAGFANGDQALDTDLKDNTLYEFDREIAVSSA